MFSECIHTEVPLVSPHQRQHQQLSESDRSRRTRSQSSQPPWIQNLERTVAPTAAGIFLARSARVARTHGSRVFTLVGVIRALETAPRAVRAAGAGGYGPGGSCCPVALCVAGCSIAGYVVCTRPRGGSPRSQTPCRWKTCRNRHHSHTSRRVRRAA